ncbi:MAG: hypothetical protein IPF96_07395 [Rhodobacter sp.]|nr:hypothetical protein [Rhodobacter sp.]
MAKAARGFAGPDAVALLRRRQPLSRLMTIGQSMGGFAALAPPAGRRPARPAASVTPGQPRPLAVDAAHRHPPPVAHLAQALCFPAAPGTDHLLFPGISHSGLAPHLKARGVLPGLIDPPGTTPRRCASRRGGRLRQRLLPDQLPR